MSTTGALRHVGLLSTHDTKSTIVRLRKEQRKPHVSRPMDGRIDSHEPYQV